MRAAGETYLPKWPKEEPEAYAARLKTATLFPAYSRTVKTLSAKPFSKPVTVGEDVPATVKPWLQDVDLEGRNLDVFAANLLEDAMGYGMAGILIDYPKNSGVKNLADERRLGLRPYWVHIKIDQILGWKAERVAGKWQINQLRLMESVAVPDGEYGEKMVQQVRVLEPRMWKTYRANKDGVFEMNDNGVTTLDYVPFVAVYGERTGFMTAKPPLMEMAYLNVQHWQSSSDQQTILHVARVPILAVIGVEDGFELKVGAASAVKLPMSSDMKYVEHGGAAIEAGRTSLTDLEEAMRQSGAELLLMTKGNATATEVATDASVSMCALQQIAQNLEDSLDQALQITAEWIGEKQGGHVTLFNDFAAATMADASAQLVLSAQQGGLISKETAIKELQRRGTLSPEVDAKVEAAGVESEGVNLGDM